MSPKTFAIPVAPLDILAGRHASVAAGVATVGIPVSVSCVRRLYPTLLFQDKIRVSADG